MHTSITPPNEVIGIHATMKFPASGPTLGDVSTWNQMNRAMSDVVGENLDFDIETAGKKNGGWVLFDKQEWSWLKIGKVFAAGVGFAPLGKDVVKYQLSIFQIDDTPD